MLSGLRNGLEGVALIGDHLTQTELKQEIMIRLFDTFIEPEGAYFLVYPHHSPLSPAANAFRDWIKKSV